jgi:uncharacterized FAD-dependent dehydrogenase
VSKIYDVAIVGAGPAGLFAAMELSCDCNVVLIDQGPDLATRIYNSSGDKVKPFGFGGSGGFSDGKIIFSNETGGRLNELLSSVTLDVKLSDVYGIWNDLSRGLDIERFGFVYNNPLVDVAKKCGLELVVSEIMHIGSDILPIVLSNIEYELDGRINIKMGVCVTDFFPANKCICLSTSDGEIWAKNVIIAPGRGGSEWLSTISNRLGLSSKDTPVDIGVRIEVPSSTTKSITDELYEFKLRYVTPSYNDLVRTFCVCPNGRVVEEKYNGTTLVNGYSNTKSKSDNTNFAFLSSIKLGQPISRALDFSKNITHTTNSIADGVLVQRLGDIIKFRRSTASSISNNSVVPTLDTASPGDLTLAYPHRFVVNIIEGLMAINDMIPGVYTDDTLLYAPEIKMYSSMADVDENMMSKIDGLYFCGDGAGTTRGIAQACVSGMVAAEHIISKI